MQNKAKVNIGKMNISIVTIKDYDKNNEQSTTNVIQNKAKQSQFSNATPAFSTEQSEYRMTLKSPAIETRAERWLPVKNMLKFPGNVLHLGR